MDSRTDRWTAGETDEKTDRQMDSRTDRWPKSQEEALFTFSGETRTRTTSVAATFARFHKNSIMLKFALLRKKLEENQQK